MCLQSLFGSNRPRFQHAALRTIPGEDDGVFKKITDFGTSLLKSAAWTAGTIGAIAIGARTLDFFVHPSEIPNCEAARTNVCGFDSNEFDSQKVKEFACKKMADMECEQSFVQSLKGGLSWATEKIVDYGAYFGETSGLWLRKGSLLVAANPAMSVAIATGVVGLGALACCCKMSKIKAVAKDVTSFTLKHLVPMAAVAGITAAVVTYTHTDGYRHPR